MKTAFPHFRQLGAMDCAPSCLRMIAQYYGKSYSLHFLRRRSFISRKGVSMLGISDLTPHKKELFQLMLGMLVVSMLQLLLSFLTQALVDVGISNSNLNFITLVLAAQLIISISQLSVEFIRSWILLHVNTFSYDDTDREYVLNNVSLFIPERKITAIVGASGKE